MTTKAYMIAPQQTIKVKLGKSVSPERRRGTLQTGSPENLLLLADSENIVESDLHSTHDQYRSGEGGTEFFDLPLNVFLSQFLDFYDDNPNRIRQLLTSSSPKLVPTEDIQPCPKNDLVSSLSNLHLSNPRINKIEQMSRLIATSIRQSIT